MGRSSPGEMLLLVSSVDEDAQDLQRRISSWRLFVNMKHQGES